MNAWDKSHPEKMRAYREKWIRLHGFKVCPKCSKNRILYSSTQCRPCYGKSKIVPVEERFWRNVKKTSTCWIWKGFINKFGYGEIQINKKSLRCHRVSWELHKGKIPQGMCVCHTCDNPSCVRPDHLWLGTSQQNTSDKVEKGRQIKGETHPMHKLTEKKVRLMRQAYTPGYGNLVKLGKQFGVHADVIGLAVRRKTWRHI